MTPVYLYSQDGRQLYYVCVALPMPPMVTYAGLNFAWNMSVQPPRYVQTLGPLLGPAPSVAVAIPDPPLDPK